MAEYVFAGCTILVDDENRYLETWFPDGTSVPATPNFDEASIALAHDLGYDGDTWAMSRDHELAHTWLAVAAGQGRSGTLWRLVHPSDPDAVDNDEVAREEARVLRFQRGLAKPGPRPWDVVLVG
jgi:hypothetical protein